MGCIIYELLMYIYFEDFNEAKNDFKENFDKKRYLFTGDSCFPLSPITKNEDKDNKTKIISKKDQIKLIL
jgi:hypothetical protein